MKYPLLLLLAVSCTTYADTDHGIRLNCPERGDLTVSFFDYNLMTMKWGDHFQIAAGKSQSHTRQGTPFWMTRFRNGDELTFFPDSGEYYLFYAGTLAPVHCTETGTLVYPAFTPPRYEKPAAPLQTQASTTNSDVVLQHPAT